MAENEKPIVDAKAEEKAVVEYIAKDNQKIKLTPQIIKKFLVSGHPEMVTLQEIYYYMGVCRSRGMNPFINDCYLIKLTQNDKAAIVVSIDYYRKRARAQSDCKGWKYGVILLKNTDDLLYREGCIVLDNETLIGGWFEALPEGWHTPQRKEVPLNRYIKKKKDGSVTSFWSKDNQPEQIAKVAESQGLRSTWPDEFQNLYTDAEMESRDAQRELSEAVSTASNEDVKKDLEKTLGESGKIEEGAEELKSKDVEEFKDEPPPEPPKKDAKKKSAGSKKKKAADDKQDNEKVEPDGSEEAPTQGNEPELSFDELTETDQWQEMIMLKEQYPKFYLKTFKGQTPRTLQAVNEGIDNINRMIAEAGGDGIPQG